MKTIPLLPVLLVLSLAANGALAFLALRRPVAAGPASSVATAASGAANAATNARPASGALAAPLAERLAAARTPADFKEVVAELRAAGLPDSLLRLVVQAAVGEDFARRQRAIFDFSSVPYWREPTPTAEQTKAMRALDRERRALLADLGLSPSPFEQSVRQRQFGGLPEAKAAALEKIQQDYTDLRMELFSQRQGPNEDRLAQERLLREEQQRDIEALLTPAEKLEWEVRTSGAAANLRRQLREVEVTEEEFRSLFAAQRSYEQVTQPGGSFPQGVRSIDQQEAALDAWDAQQAELRRVLGDDRYRKAALQSPNVFGSRLNEFIEARPQLGSDQVAAILRLPQAISVEMARANSGPGISADERRARTAAVRDRIRAELTQLLGATTAQELIATGALPGFGRPPGATPPAVRLPGGG